MTKKAIITALARENKITKGLRQHRTIAKRAKI